MKDAEFLELLNLYLDHEISAADAARLESEVQRNAKRREVYRQYCRMQKACTLLAKDFAEQAAPAIESERITAFSARRTAWTPAIWSTVGLAAAAAVAFVFIGRNQAVAPTATQPVAAAITTPAPEPLAPPPGAVSDVRAIARTIAAPARRVELQPVLTANTLTVANTEIAVPVQFDWMKGVQFAPIAPAADELRFESRPTLKAGSSVYRSGRPMQGNFENAAFQFQK